MNILQDNSSIIDHKLALERYQFCAKELDS